jgi:hypothetical protein
MRPRKKKGRGERRKDRDSLALRALFGQPFQQKDAWDASNKLKPGEH